MTTDNGTRIVAFRLAGFIATLFYAAYIFLAYFPKVFRNLLTDKSLTIITVSVSVVYLLVLLWPTLMKYNYLFFSADERSITLRWYKPGLIPGESRSIEIPAGSFAGYEIKKEFMGVYQYIILYQTVQGRRAAYPPVAVTALSKAQKQEIETALKGYTSAH